MLVARSTMALYSNEIVLCYGEDLEWLKLVFILTQTMA